MYNISYRYHSMIFTSVTAER